MSRLQPSAPITAITYGDGLRITPVLDRIASHLITEGFRLAGLIQREATREGRSRCDMLLEDLASGESIPISQDRGEDAHGCRLDVEALLNAVAQTRTTLPSQPDLLIVNKFGKTECEGGGCRPLIAEALEHDVPVLVAVPWGNLEVWRRFAGDLAVEFRLDDMPGEGARLCQHLGFIGGNHSVTPPLQAAHSEKS